MYCLFLTTYTQFLYCRLYSFGSLFLCLLKRSLVSIYTNLCYP
uniref:Uncharacterized protein n=1 Tax=Siphoviridae sp. ctS3r5 TaxID=2826341 RepID=A0A8S5N9U3_9CAUD|nr:MAG TPA: hypothetical protein [Siphoviridae sp. ctS3r5]